ncbi:MAG TPA: tetratricopeptide repeat protein, partial [Bryobacteraceae bacterium]|nr:tetratricopeptide repeat protein [Bryobacteraceae bacterium]
NLSRTSKALWNILTGRDLRSIVIGWWPSHPAEPIAGVMVSDHFHRANAAIEEGWPAVERAVHPPELAREIASLRVHPDSLTPELVEPFIPLAREIDQDADKRLALLLRTLAECMSVHAAALWLMEHQPWDFCAVYHDAIDHFCHGFMRYHPPRQSWIKPRDFEIYAGVVGAAYRFHDRMLGEMLARAGAATVILMSDHGFHPDHLRPASIPDFPAGPAIEHRDFGILAMGGAGVKRAELRGASLLDIAPTVLARFGLPVGEDMDGKPLLQAFAEPPKIEFIPSWETVAGFDGCHPANTRLDPAAAQASLEQMIALGYIERPDADRELAVRKTIRELRYNLAESYQDAGRHAEAREILIELHATNHTADPAADSNDQRCAVRLFASSEALGMLDEMRQIAGDLAARKPSPVADYLNARVAIAEKRYPDALAVLERIGGDQPGVLVERAELHLRLRQWAAARALYESALALDRDRVDAYQGLCRIALQQRDFESAARLALEAIERVHSNASPHHLLGRALTGMREFERAAAAYRAAIAIHPNFPGAHLRLASLLEYRLGDAATAAEHRQFARAMRSAASTRHDGPRTIEPGAETPHVETMVAMNHSTQPDGAPLAETLIVVTGLPRSGTSMLMQMLAAGGMEIVADHLRQPDQDNPRGYLEIERVKNLLKDSKWLLEHRGQAIKIVAPLLAGLPPELPCRVILIERDLDEVLDSQRSMIARRGQSLPDTPERRKMLKGEFARTLARTEAMLVRRPLTRLLPVKYSSAVADPRATAERIDQFLGGGLDVARMAAAVDGALHRNRATI